MIFKAVDESRMNKLSYDYLEHLQAGNRAFVVMPYNKGLMVNKTANMEHIQGYMERLMQYEYLDEDGMTELLNEIDNEFGKGVSNIFVYVWSDAKGEERTARTEEQARKWLAEHPADVEEADTTRFIESIYDVCEYGHALRRFRDSKSNKGIQKVFLYGYLCGLNSRK